MRGAKRRFYSIQNAMVLALAVITLGIVATTTLVAFRYTMEEVRYVSVDYTSQLISQVNRDIDRYVGYMEDVSEVVGKNATVKQWIDEGGELGVSERLVLEDSLNRQIGGIMNSRRDIANIAIFTDPDRVVFDTRGKMLNEYAEYKTTDWYTEAVRLRGGTYVSSSHVQNVVAGRYPWVVSISRAITAGDGTVKGVLLVDLNYSVINTVCSDIDMGNRGYIFLVDRDGNIIFHPQQQLIYSHIKSEDVQAVLGASTQMSAASPDGEKLYISEHSDVTGWTVVGVAYQDELLRDQDNIVQFYVIIFGVFLLVAVLLSAVISSAITGPLKNLVNTMRDVEQGELDTRIDLAGPREVNQLSRAFNTMMDRLKGLMDQRDREQEQRRKSELRALQAQINPHFLYNTLDSIIWMAENEKNEDVVEMTAALAHLFRSSISESRETVPLRVEVANIRSYLTIQQMRYKEKMRFDIDIPEELNGYMLPKLLLQPLVENAIYHGIKPKGTGGHIAVRAYREAEYLYIEIQDDGLGMEEGVRENILAAKPSKTGSGIGVKNVHERIRLQFGEEYGLQYISAVGEGTTVRMVLPGETEGGEP